MKKYVCVLLLLFCLSGICFSQNYNTWRGTVRFNPADNFINLHNALPGLYITWTPYVLPKLGVPAEIDINFGWGVLPGFEISFLNGVEYISIGPAGKEKNGHFLDVKIGFSVSTFEEETRIFFAVKSNIGYQFIAKKGFVFIPAIGFVYNGRSGIGLNLMLDLGFAYH